MRRPLLHLPLAVLFAVSWLVAAARTGPVATAQEVSRLVTVQQSGVLRVCTTGDYPPYTLREDDAYRGVDITLASDLAATLHVVPQWIPTTWSTLTDDFLAQCDIAVGGISDTTARRQVADFSIPTSIDGKTPVTRRADADTYATIDQINRPEVRVIVNRGGTNEAFARTNFPEAQLTIWPDNLTIYDQLEQHRADVFVTDSVEGRYRQRTHPTLQVLHPDTPFDSAAKAYLLPKGDVLFNTVVNTWLESAIRSGRADQLLADWIG
ncbi:transporter substrate-binding domain-containing protein [Nocardia sp. NBC_00565]|uniref:transporter substrate-binding domain-containing protein n=1 Tax=Nocardia sp. NBC_00565 TaxID=2975993 RepID=UPI002E7FFC75|nr:transporter substrate-binding domain-containing protein [Nocardia sp. NBC_00565]WUC04895.1 transporter substrate-binding domain-containing protein [Nocardia sp. NBC_00565]